MGDVAGGDFAADYGTGDDFFLERYRRDYFDGEPMMRAQFSQPSYVSGLLVAEAKIFPYEHGAYMKAAHEDLLDEFFGRDAREIECEGKDDGGFEAYAAEPFHALCVGG